MSSIGQLESAKRQILEPQESAYHRLVMLEPKGWYSRDYLPHFDRSGLVQGITFRLHDSMPASLLERREKEIQTLSPSLHNAERQKRIAAYLDAGRGACWLREPHIAEIVENTILHFDSERYRLLAWVVMPNHVHVLAETYEEWPLDKVIQSWKTWSAKRANEILGRSGMFWCRDFHDRYIRDAEHLANAKRYIEQNPVKAGLCRDGRQWRWGSAWQGRVPPSSSTATSVGGA